MANGPSSQSSFLRISDAMTFVAPYNSRSITTSSEPICPNAPVTKIFFIANLSQNCCCTQNCISFHPVFFLYRTYICLLTLSHFLADYFIQSLYIFILCFSIRCCLYVTHVHISF